MLILSLDTTTRGGSVAIVRLRSGFHLRQGYGGQDGATDARDEQLLAVIPGDAARSHAERLPGEIEAALARAGLRRADLDLLAVATGPGAFTGLRIGLATMQGLAMTLGLPVIGISALDALADEVPDEAALIAPWMDAQRGEVFATLIERASHRTLEPPLAALPALVLDAWQPHLAGRTAVFIGDATERDSALIAGVGTGQWTTRTPPLLAPALARLAGRRAAQGEGGLPHQLTPIYVRRPDVEIERERKDRP